MRERTLWIIIGVLAATGLSIAALWKYLMLIGYGIAGLLALALLVAIGVGVYRVRHHLAMKKLERDNARMDLELKQVAIDERYALARQRDEEHAAKMHLIHTAMQYGHQVKVTQDSYHYEPPMRQALLPAQTTQQQNAKIDNDEQPVLIHPPFDFDAALRTFRPSMQGIFLGRAMTEVGHKDIIVPLGKLWHIALAGYTGGGKSTVLMLIFAQLLSDAVKAECYFGNPLYAPYYTSDDGRLVDWRPIEARLKHPVLYDPQTIAEMLEENAYSELDKRAIRRREGKPIGPPRFIGIDEWPLVVAEHPNAVGAMSKLLRTGRQLGIFTVAATQDMLVKTIGGDSGVRECYRTGVYTGGDTKTAKIILDLPQGQKADVEGLGDKGLVYLKTPITSAQIVRIPWVSETSCYDLLGYPNTVNSTVQETFSDVRVNSSTNGLERSLEADVQNVGYWHFDRKMNKEGTILKVWGCRKGGSREYREASQKYDEIVTALLESEAR